MPQIIAGVFMNKTRQLLHLSLLFVSLVSSWLVNCFVGWLVGCLSLGHYLTSSRCTGGEKQFESTSVNVAFPNKFII